MASNRCGAATWTWSLFMESIQANF
jgi:hypothetical protein